MQLGSPHRVGGIEDLAERREFHCAADECGGTGEVYLVRHPRLPREDALKVLRPDVSCDEEFRQRFIREADLASALKHPNIVTVHDRGEFDGQLWIATEYVEGTDAAQLMAARYPVGMPVEEAAAIITPIADALDYAHGRGLLHRDVKPANILLGQPDHAGQRRVFLADFGIARPMADPNGLTATNLTLGTVAYAAPEQLMGDDIDGRADQYALAASAFHLLTGTTPYENSNPVAVISAHLNAAPPVLSERRADLGRLDWVLAKALAKEPSQRFQTCGQFAAAFRQAMGTPISAQATESARPVAPKPIGPPIPAASAAPRRNRRRTLFLTMTAVVIAGIGAVAATAYIHNAHQSTAPALTLEGSYRVVYDYSRETTKSGAPAHLPNGTNNTFYWAFRSSCISTGCVATGTALDTTNPLAERRPGLTSVMHLTEGHWQEVPAVSQIEVPECHANGGTYLPGSDTVRSAWSLEPLPDGVLRGVLTRTVLTNECGRQGLELTVPFVATRIGDVPPAVVLADP